jgi:hypothetical protein
MWRDDRGIAKLPELLRKSQSARGVRMEDFDPIKAWNEILLKKLNEANATEAPNPVSLESISARLPPEGQAWLNGLNRLCRRAVGHDLRRVGPDLFVQYWEQLRDTLQKLERDFGPSDNWK